MRRAVKATQSVHLVRTGQDFLGAPLNFGRFGNVDDKVVKATLEEAMDYALELGEWKQMHFQRNKKERNWTPGLEDPTTTTLEREAIPVRYEDHPLRGLWINRAINVCSERSPPSD